MLSQCRHSLPSAGDVTHSEMHRRKKLPLFLPHCEASWIDSLCWQCRHRFNSAKKSSEHWSDVERAWRTMDGTRGRSAYNVQFIQNNVCVLMQYTHTMCNRFYCEIQMIHILFVYFAVVVVVVFIAVAGVVWKCSAALPPSFVFLLVRAVFLRSAAIRAIAF